MRLQINFEFEVSEKGELLRQISQGGCLPIEINVSDNMISLTFVNQSLGDALRLIASISDVVAVTGLRFRQTTEIGNRLASVATALKEAGYTQHNLGEAAQISTGYVSKLLNGKVTAPTEDAIAKLCAGLKKLGSKELVHLADEILAEFE